MTGPHTNIRKLRMQSDAETSSELGVLPGLRGTIPHLDRFGGIGQKKSNKPVDKPDGACYPKNSKGQ